VEAFDLVGSLNRRELVEVRVEELDLVCFVDREAVVVAPDELAAGAEVCVRYLYGRS